jgi:heat shock protein HtpX
MTLLQGIVNTFVMFAARVIAFAISNFLRDRDENGRGLSHIAQMFVVMALEMVFMILGSLVISAFSRYREYRADEGGAKLAGRENMISALQGLQKMFEPIEEGTSLQTMKIASGNKWIQLFSTHPTLESRIARLSGRMS